MVFRVGDQAYIIENNSHVIPVYVKRRSGDFYTVISGEMGATLRAGRLFRTREEAEKKLAEKERQVPHGQKTKHTNPYDHIDYYSPYGA